MIIIRRVSLSGMGLSLAMGIPPLVALSRGGTIDLSMVMWSALFGCVGVFLGLASSIVYKQGITRSLLHWLWGLMGIGLGVGLSLCVCASKVDEDVKLFYFAAAVLPPLAYLAAIFVFGREAQVEVQAPNSST